MSEQSPHVKAFALALSQYNPFRNTRDDAAEPLHYLVDAALKMKLTDSCNLAAKAGMTLNDIVSIQNGCVPRVKDKKKVHRALLQVLRDQTPDL